MTNHMGHRLTFLPNLNQELNDAGSPLRVTVGLMDQAIIEACSNFATDKPLMQYLLPCWKRAIKTPAAKGVSPTRVGVHDEAKRLCMSNCLFALTMPDLYGRNPNPEHDTIAPFLIRGVVDENGLDFEFIQEAIKRFDDDEAFPNIFNDAMVRISTQLSQMSMSDSYKGHVQVR